jgi:hypothetical protein
VADDCRHKTLGPIPVESEHKAAAAVNTCADLSQFT